MLCYVMLCYVMLCYVMLCYVMLCYVMLCVMLLIYLFIYIQSRFEARNVLKINKKSKVSFQIFIMLQNKQLF